MTALFKFGRSPETLISRTQVSDLYDLHLAMTERMVTDAVCGLRPKYLKSLRELEVNKECELKHQDMIMDIMGLPSVLDIGGDEWIDPMWMLWNDAAAYKLGHSHS